MKNTINNYKEQMISLKQTLMEKKNNIKDSTATKYVNIIQTLANKCEAFKTSQGEKVFDYNKLADVEKVMSVINAPSLRTGEPLSNQTKKAQLIALNEVLKLVNEKKYSKKIEYYKSFIGGFDTIILTEYKKNIPSKKQEENWSDLDELQSKLFPAITNDMKEIIDKKTQIKSGKHQSLLNEYLAALLYSGKYIPPRRISDFVKMERITATQFNTLLKNDELKNNNYLVLTPKRGLFSFGEYKTDTKYRVQIVQIPSELKEILKQVLEVSKDNKRLFVQPDKATESLTAGGLGKTFKRVMSKYVDKLINSQMIRSIYITSMFKDKSTGQKEAIAALMGTSLATANTVYSKHMKGLFTEPITEVLSPELFSESDDE